MSAGATREERRRDAVALGLLAGGVAFFVVAFIGFQRLPARTHALHTQASCSAPATVTAIDWPRAISI